MATATFRIGTIEFPGDAIVAGGTRLTNAPAVLPNISLPAAPVEAAPHAAAAPNDNSPFAAGEIATFSATTSAFSGLTLIQSGDSFGLGITAGDNAPQALLNKGGR